MTAPDLETLRDFVHDAASRLANSRIVVHCHAGVGRTSVITCCIVQRITGMNVDDTITYVKKHMEVNMTSEQMSVVKRFAA